MMSRRTHIAAIAIAISAVIVLGATRAIATDDGYKLVVHPDNPVSEVDRDFVRDAFLKKALEWPNGQTIRPVDLSDSFPAHDRFARTMLRKTPSQLKSYWNQQIFSGKGVPPPSADTTAAMIAYVLANPGALGYLPSDANPGSLKVVGVR